MHCNTPKRRVKREEMVSLRDGFQLFSSENTTSFLYSLFTFHWDCCVLQQPQAAYCRPAVRHETHRFLKFR